MGQHAKRVIKRLIDECYKNMLMRMVIDSSSEPKVVPNFYLLCDVEVLLGLSCLIPLLEVVKSLIQILASSVMCLYVILLQW
jgi:hypothetical protein